jgi:outer membrane lipoprotein LolB
VIARLAAAAVLVLASGCAALPPAAVTEDWPARRERLQALDRWTLNGRIAVAAGEDGFSGGFDWDQQGERADIALTGPMGSSAMDIHVEGEQAIVSIRGESVDAEDAEALFARYFGPGQKLPVEQMRYWLVGAPAPGAPHEEALAEQGRLASLAQSGWRVRYDRYAAVGTLALPARMELTTEGLRLRVAVSDWRLPP